MRKSRPSSNGTGAGAEAIDWPSVLACHDRWLRLVILARLGEKQAVEEVLQEVALAACSARSRSVAPERMTAWLYRLAVRQALLYRRRRGRHRRLIDRYASLQPDPARNGHAHDPDPLGWLIRDERARRVRDALGRLAPRDAEILLLKYADGWTAPELAERLGVSLSAVEARLHRVRGRLREILVHHDLIESSERLS